MTAKDGLWFGSVSNCYLRIVRIMFVTMPMAGVDHGHGSALYEAGGSLQAWCRRMRWRLWV
jgi:hypothetical protein